MSSLFNIAAGGGKGDFYNYEINNSLRLNRGDSASLQRTPSSEGDRQTNTTSLWVKRSELGRTTRLFMATTNATNARYTILEFNSTDTIRFYGGTEGSSALFNTQTNALFRDVSAWYHIVAVLDTTQATASNRVKLYVNGTQITSLLTATYGSQNASYALSDDIAHYINKDGSSLGNNYSTYYVADVNFIDGQALDPTSFGELKSGVWIPKDTSGLTFGTNGFRLEFGDSAAIGDDTSGNTNDFTPVNLAAVDVTLDSPTNNFATLNPLIKGTTYGVQSDPTPTNGNLEIAMPSGTNNIAVSTFELQAPNKYRCSFELTSRGSSTNFEFGIGNVTDSINNGDVFYNSAGTIGNESGTQQSGLTDANTVGDIVEILVDLDANNVKFALKENGSSTWAALGTAESITANVTNPIVWVREQGSSNINGKFDFGQLGYVGSDDENYLPMSTANLPEPPISPLDDDVPEDYFEANLWIGNGSSQSISSYEFAPDWVWIKERSSTSSHYVVDTVRGANLFLQTNSTVADSSNTVNVTSFDSNGFSLGTGGTTNQSSQTYVGWAWLAGGTAVSNTQGSITSSVSANTKAGFSIVSYSGTGSAATVGHGLSQTPDMMIVKNRDDGTRSWIVYHKDNTSAPETDFLRLDGTNATADTPVWNDTAPTSSVFSVNDPSTNGSGNNIIAYLFHSVEGYSKFGSYSGSSSNDGTYVYTGFRPAFVMSKVVSGGTGGWIMHDNKRGSSNEADPTITNNNVVDDYLLANSSGTENTGINIDFLSNGFKWRSASSSTTLNHNVSGDDYIYMAFAEMPTKYANAK